MDWDHEPPWRDNIWVRLAAAVLYVAVCLFARPASAVPAIGCSGIALAFLWQDLRTRRHIARETGLTPRQVAVAARLMRKEDIPSDPTARHAMTLLLHRQRRTARTARRLVLALAALFAVLGTALLVWGPTAKDLAVLHLALAALLLATLPFARRTTRRLARTEAQLTPPAPLPWTPS
ncbi:hypothetical protein [Streptomyces sp. CBMA29]|uniref:hypothetical protein n=1 Tax=Streptomyces sp. CBMA29 TaxID=1896314 RepID=UPI001661A8CC|nr:hypothetical protein [Streptomyces sp. CBMA29]MBD0739490.1 hypothetical protein [Streptomyces sp. CBMA29]